MAFVEAERERHPGEVYPQDEELFAAFRLTPYDEVKVVLLGQDPYPSPGDAMGLSFSVRPDRPLTKSLLSINLMMAFDELKPLTHGDLTPWGEQGVLLLNTALTVVRKDAGSHLEQWEPFTEAVIEILLARDLPMVFLLWGGPAKKWERRIKATAHKAVAAPHPTSREPALTRFRESRSFSQVNDLLVGMGHDPIDWEIS
jgi:uracil-DNA glycosylase